ncbi:hypothetical protein [Lentzea jiangxiensis]|uniref:Uncharacterized protein n=1 Tax=Lentzea jiangxiensis TaxID=641025 RepID=A0A1H0K0E1_9PSEU|nr:hypothetical protein [Lentzea jiangxiensis]SDO49407.1 hypothetical protein SAMN05421507_102708 [Lentzea jiangxiensis]
MRLLIDVVLALTTSPVALGPRGPRQFPGDVLLELTRNFQRCVTDRV